MVSPTTDTKGTTMLPKPTTTNMTMTTNSMPTRKQATATTMKETHMLKKRDTPKAPRTKSSCRPPRHRPQA